LPPRFRRVVPERGTPPLNFSFACGGWLQFYLFGVAKCLTDHGLHAVGRSQKFIGSSAGALTAAGMALDADWDAVIAYVKSTVLPQVWGSPAGPFRITRYCRDCMARCVNLGAAAELPHGELTAVVTQLSGLRALRVSAFRDAAHLADAVLASAAAIPIASAIRLDGRWCVDGGLSEFHPRLDPTLGETVYVNPFYFSHADIRPSRYVPVWWAFLPPRDPNSIDWLYDLGYSDALDWMRRRRLAHCCKHRPSAAPAAAAAATAAPPANDAAGAAAAAAAGDRPTLARIFGYGGSNTLLDAVLVFWMAVLWRPATFLLVTAELVLLVAAAVGSALWAEAAPLAPAAAAAAALLLP
ncbi:acyl transferase/acyl hydrolase/lysophospholipase, partial [Tribonema minus]